MQLFSAETLNHSNLEQWKRKALETFTAKISGPNPPFPCIPATIGLRLNHFRYGFVTNSNNDNSAEQAASLLEEYSKCYKEFGSYTSLIIFYEPCEDFKKFNVEDYEQLFWAKLNQLTELDSIIWPGQIPKDPENPFWEFCFHGEQYFIYCATPAHKKRNSRHFPYFMLAITPRWVLENFYLSEKNALKIKENIRQRLEDYDSVPIHPDLNTYGKQDNFEWKQYFLRDDDTSLPQCPFHSKKKRADE